MLSISSTRYHSGLIRILYFPYKEIRFFIIRILCFLYGEIVILFVMKLQVGCGRGVEYELRSV